MNIGSAPTQAEFHEAISNRSDRWYSACLKITRNPDMAADAVQDALLNAWNKRHQFEQTARLDTWIHRIAINSACTASVCHGEFITIQVALENMTPGEVLDCNVIVFG